MREEGKGREYITQLEILEDRSEHPEREQGHNGVRIVGKEVASFIQAKE